MGISQEEMKTRQEEIKKGQDEIKNDITAVQQQLKSKID